jgi:hypothetical protein
VSADDRQVEHEAAGCVPPDGTPDDAKGRVVVGSRGQRRRPDMPGRRQPLLGITATALVIAVSLAFIALFDWPTFRDWVSFFLICTIPFAFVVGPFWKGE